ncbi:MAG: Serine/threonine-protein kinase BtrW [Candidatus Accumulibacter appositus]|uniref:Serine/threonine-protein kinase BtrW n=1 Tax=Candidatus Accumulibacter appositus TaxID=1454003 RepID=A0A011NCF8_9PROT|nr:anti-sigma regulatory factor [Accumulibacter sp.]EXI80348.1 MAG: Serine/threonine-protein kinase BtrW [Candidatus Accumulibacter appositus]HRF03085.1 anti-sigma regulatory factor [Accumulibacter sp.]
MARHSIPANLAALATVRQLVTQACREAGLDDAASYRLILAVDEIATNIITHGYQEQGSSGDIAIAIEAGEQYLSVVLEDTGIAYDPRAQGMPTAEDLDKPLSDREIGGLGVFLALQGVDRFDYQHHDKVNRNTLAVKLPQAKR